MLFLNRPPDAEILPGMGYAPGARSLGYAAGARSLGYAPGARSLGAVSNSQMQAALAAGLDSGTLAALSAVGATDTDIQTLMAGDTDVATLLERYGGLQSGEGTIVTYTGGTNPAPAAQVPSGSTLLYTATVVGGPGDLTVSPDSAMSQFASALASHGMSVAESSNDETVLNKIFGTGSAIHFQFSILDTVGNAFLSDAKSVCDGVLRQIVGNNVTTSNISIVSTPTRSTAPGATPTTDIVAWLESNALYIGFGIAGFVLLNSYMGGRRR